MEEKLKKQTAIKFLETVKQGVSDLFISDSTINTLYSSLDELNKINNRKLIITPGTCGIINSKQSYLAIVPQSYSEKYSYEDGIGSYPWLWFNFSKSVSDETKFNVQIIKDGIVCTFSDEVSKLGTLSSDNKVVTISSKSYFSFEIIKDLNISRENIFGNYEIVITNEEGEDKQIFEIFYSKKGY